MEQRRGVRVPVRLWTLIAGVDDEWQLRRGDVSVSGVYFDIDREVGEPGSLQRIGISSYDRGHSCDVMARIVRVSTVQDLWRGPTVTGTAFEFLPETAESRSELEAVIRAAIGAASHASESLRFDYHFEAQVERQTADASAAPAAILDVRSMELQTSWEIEVGETVHCQVAVPDSERSIAISGRAIACELLEEEPKRFRVIVEFEGEGEAAVAVTAESTSSSAGSIDDAMDLLMEEVLFPSVADGVTHDQEHLRGLLSRIRLSSLLGFFELERITGELQLRHDNIEACVYVRDGAVVDATLGVGEQDPAATLTQVLAWQSGEFEFSVAQVDRPDVFNTPTGALLLEIAHLQETPDQVF